MKHLPRILVFIGAAVTVFSVYKIIEQMTRGLREEGHFVPSEWHMDMDTDAANGRVDWITLPETWRP